MFIYINIGKYLSEFDTFMFVSKIMVYFPRCDSIQNWNLRKQNRMKICIYIWQDVTDISDKVSDKLS